MVEDNSCLSYVRITAIRTVFVRESYFVEHYELPVAIELERELVMRAAIAYRKHMREKLMMEGSAVSRPDRYALTIRIRVKEGKAWRVRKDAGATGGDESDAATEMDTIVTTRRHKRILADSSPDVTPHASTLLFDNGEDSYRVESSRDDSDTAPPPKRQALTLPARIANLLGEEGTRAYKWARERHDDHIVQTPFGNVKLFLDGRIDTLRHLSDSDMMRRIEFYSLARQQYMSSSYDRQGVR